MPNINLTTLSAIPEVNQIAMTQVNAATSGAYAITAAVGAFGVFPQVAYLSYGALQLSGSVYNTAVTALDNNYQQLSSAVYQITGILNNNIPHHPPILPEYIDANGYNSIAAMARVAIQLGRPAPIINAQPAGYGQFNIAYTTDFSNCYELVGNHNVDVSANIYTSPTESSTHILLVNNMVNPHWVVQGSDGLFYDPADGSLNNDWGTTSSFGEKLGPKYIFAGIWIVIH